jgi:hypothetical protein
VKLLEVTCRCGYTARGSENEVIRLIQAHGRSDHAMDLTPAEIRAVWRVVEDDLADDPLGQGVR